MKYQIEVVETLSKMFEIEAPTPEQARDIVKQRYSSGDIILTADNANVDYEINRV